MADFYNIPISKMMIRLLEIGYIEMLKMNNYTMEMYETQIKKKFTIYYYCDNIILGGMLNMNDETIKIALSYALGSDLHEA